MRRRNFLIASSAAAAAAGLHTQPADAFVREGKRKVLVFSGGQPVPVLDPHVKYDYSTRMMQQSIYDALAKYVDNPARIVPWLAKSWESSPDGKTWTFHLVENATFHNGDPVDAEAVRFSYERGLKLNKGVAWMLKDHLDPSGIKAADPHTVVFTLKSAFPGFLSFVPWWFIVNPKEVMAHAVNGDMGQKYLTDHAAGSGPFKIRRWDPQAVMDLQAVANYWKGWPEGDANRPAGVIYQVIREPAPRKAALLRGQVDMVTDMTPQDYDQLAKTAGIKVSSNPGMTPFTIMMNTQHGPTADLNFRKALAWAMDYKAFLQVENGAAKLMDSPFPNAMAGHIAVPDMPHHDLEKARAYLAKTKWAKGGLTIDYVYVAGLEVERQLGLAVLSSLQPLNIKVNVQAMPWPQLVARGSNPQTGPAMIAVYVTPVSTDPDVVASQYASSAAGRYWGMHHLSDPGLDKMVETARLETDPTKRMALYAEIQKRIVADQPAIFGMMEDRRWAMRDDVRGFVFCPVRLTGEVDFYPMWVA
ncbi:MAG: ABC transporter substrate-binding protein [Rhodospirillales bacterium]|nr:ABC transporter substrate-binding protein [Rhodospirillales bacterium]